MRHKEGVVSLAFSPDGKYLATGSMDETAVVWELSDGRKIAEFQHDDCVDSVAFSPDGELLASGSHQIAVVWELSDGRKISKFQHSLDVLSVSFSPDGRYLATGSYDTTAVVWELSDGEKLAEFQHPGWVRSVAFSPDGKYLCHGGMNRKFCVAEWRNHKIIRTEYHEYNIWEKSWFKRIPAYRMSGVFSPFAILPGKYYRMSGVFSPFAILPGKYTWRMCLSRRGFLALGYNNGTIEIIREGKGI